MTITIGRRALVVALVVFVVGPLVAAVFSVIGMNVDLPAPDSDAPMFHVNPFWVIVSLINFLLLILFVVAVAWLIRRLLTSRRNDARLAQMDERLARIETKLDQGSAGSDDR